MTGFEPVHPARQRDQLARDDVRGKVGLGELEQPLERVDRVAVAPRSSAMRLVLPLGSTATGGGDVAEMAAIVEFGQRRLDGAVAAVDDQHLGLDPGDRRHRLADLVGALDLIMEDVGMLGAKGADARQLGEVARRLGVRQKAIRGRFISCSRGPTDRPCT